MIFGLTGGYGALRFAAVGLPLNYPQTLSAAWVAANNSRLGVSAGGSTTFEIWTAFSRLHCAKPQGLAAAHLRGFAPRRLSSALRRFARRRGSNFKTCTNVFAA